MWTVLNEVQEAERLPFCVGGIGVKDHCVCVWPLSAATSTCWARRRGWNAGRPRRSAPAMQPCRPSVPSWRQLPRIWLTMGASSSAGPVHGWQQTRGGSWACYMLTLVVTWCFVSVIIGYRGTRFFSYSWIHLTTCVYYIYVDLFLSLK